MNYKTYSDSEFQEVLERFEELRKYRESESLRRAKALVAKFPKLEGIL
jgi:hypothetical protein